MLNTVLLSTFILNVIFSMPMTQPANEVEIFDINQGEVVQTVPAYLNVQDEAISYINNITGVYQKFNPIPRDGMMVKIPLEQAYLVKSEWLSGFIDEVIIIFPENEDPFLLLFDEENSPHFFNFKGELFKLLKQINVVKEGLSMER